MCILSLLLSVYIFFALSENLNRNLLGFFCVTGFMES